MGPGAGLDSCGKSRPTGIRFPDLPARSESLYLLRYPGSPRKQSMMKFLVGIYFKQYVNNDNLLYIFQLNGLHTSSFQLSIFQRLFNLKTVFGLASVLIHW